jgi:hypothetical protein
MRRRAAVHDHWGRAFTILLFSPGKLNHFFHQFHLNLLNLEQALPLVGQKLVHLGVELADLQFGLQVGAVVVLGAQAVLGLLAVLALCSMVQSRRRAQ